MRYIKVGATSFGPLHGEELEFGPGLNVVVGPNEARKSSWHAAMYSALCGRRRGKGRASADEQAFEDRHRPWNDPDWIVSAEISLDDGRSIELRHDLDAKRSDVIDLEFGRAVDDDIMFEGSPDGSKWLGLDRRTFLATACVRQAEILAVADEPTGLRSLLQRAASTLGGDMTASGAIEALSQYRREQVGRDQANSTRPLRRAKQGLVEATERCEEASDAHRRYQDLVSQLNRAASELEVADHDLKACEHAVGVVAGRSELAELEHLMVLAERLSQAESTTSDIVDLESLRGSLAQWSMSIAPRELSGPTSEEIAIEIAAIPAAVPDDSVVDPDIAQLSARLGEARVLVEAAGEAPSAEPVDPDLDQAVEIARLAGSAPPSPPLDLVSEYQRLTMLRRAHERQHRYSRLAMRFAAAGAVVAIVVALVGVFPVAAVVGAGSLLVAGASALLMHSTQGDADDRLLVIEQTLADHEAKAVDHVERSRRAQSWLAERGLPIEPAAVATLVANRHTDHSARLQRSQRLAEREQGVVDAESRLMVALETKGVVRGDVDSAMSAYVEQVGQAGTIMQRRLDLPRLEDRRTTRLQTETDHQEQDRRHDAACQGLRDGVEAMGHLTSSAQEAADIAESLISDQEAIRAGAKRTDQLRTELSTRLDGRDLEAVESRLGELQGSLSGEPELAEQNWSAKLTAADTRRNELVETLAGLRGHLEAIEEVSVDTASALAGVEAARREVERVEQLGETLDLTCRYLEEAETEAYRTVAPMMAAEVNAHLESLTSGRYSDAVIDPEELTVRVRDSGGALRDADRLSHGTSEQIHLLLRVAMVRTLTDAGESCPLLIDDATVHADRHRTEAILDLLLDLAEDRQVVLFSQESQVRDWAERNLSGDMHRVIDLEAA